MLQFGKLDLVSAAGKMMLTVLGAMAEMARQNRVLMDYINGIGPTPTYYRTVIDGLLDKVAAAVEKVESQSATSVAPALSPVAIKGLNTAARAAPSARQVTPSELS